MLTNTDAFSPVAKIFNETGNYCQYPKGTYSYKDFWDEQLHYLTEGFSYNGSRISGAHYGYLNFCQISLTDDIDTKRKGGRVKKKAFPRFYDTDQEYFLALERARLEGKGMIVAKSRRKGFSYKNAWLVAHQFITVRNSVSIIGAYLDDFADNTIGMIIDDLNFINKKTAFYKQRNPDRRDFMKAQFKETSTEGIETWEGSMSEIHKLSFKDDPFKSIGKSTNLFLWEEAGKWPNLKASYRFSEPTWMDGEFTIGMPIIFGTGGDMEGGTMDFAEMFYNPDAFNLLAFDNIWDNNATTKCGYFVPDYKSRPGFIDKWGNSLESEAKESEEKKRKKLSESTKSTADLDAYISQYPFTPKEAFRRRGGNVFPVGLLQDHLGWLETNKDAANLGQVGILKWVGGKVEWEPRDIDVIKNFPVKPGERIEGAIQIWEHPEEVSGSIPHGLYIAGTDPYDIDEAATSDSLGSTFIYKRMISADKTYNWPVAEYTGRPDSSEEYYENVRKLLTYYNAIDMYENQLKGMFVYFQTRYCTHLLADQPLILKDVIKDSVVNRAKGVHMSVPVKNFLEIITRDWLKEEYAPGRMNLTKIFSKPLLQELIAYNRDEGNFDRVIAFMLSILHDKNLYTYTAIEEQPERDPFWDRELFKRINRF